MQYFCCKTNDSKMANKQRTKTKVFIHTEKWPSPPSLISNGFSLIEILVTISIAAIAFTIAIPSLSDFTVQMRVDNEVSKLQRLLLITRSAAINSGQNATLCPLQDDNTCDEASTNWASRIGAVSVDGLILEREAIQGGDELYFAFDSVTYNPSGQLNTGNIGLFSYCPNGSTDFCRGVDLSLSGRTYLSSDINGDGKDQDRNGNNITPH
jgi:prepilin-type N-terminal cleavage/methylation domain-containing protein